MNPVHAFHHKLERGYNVLVMGRSSAVFHLVRRAACVPHLVAVFVLA